MQTKMVQQYWMVLVIFKRLISINEWIWNIVKNDVKAGIKTGDSCPATKPLKVPKG